MTPLVSVQTNEGHPRQRLSIAVEGTCRRIQYLVDGDVSDLFVFGRTGEGPCIASDTTSSIWCANKFDVYNRIDKYRVLLEIIGKHV